MYNLHANYKLKLNRLNRIAKCCNSWIKLFKCCLFIAFSSLLFPSCELEPNDIGNNVEIQLLNGDGFPIQGEGWLVASIGNYPIAIPNYFGYFRFENIHTPYDLKVYYWGITFSYKQINTRNLHLVLLRSYPTDVNECPLIIKFPEIQNGEYGYLHFISKDIFEQDYNNIYFIRPSHNSTEINIQIPVEKKSISGKLLFFKCEADESNYLDIYSFKNFGVKDVLVHEGENETIEFSQEDIEFNPPESSVQINISYPQFYHDRYLIFKLSFPGYNKNSDIIIGYYYNPSNTNIQTVPVNLNIPFTIKAESMFRDEQRSIPHEIWPRKVTNINTGETGTILHKKIELTSPGNNEEGIKSSTFLKAEESGDKGIYLFCIGKDSSAGTVYTITDKSFVMLGDMASNFFQISPNTLYSWKAGKLSSFTSIDEFLSEPYIFQENFNTIEFSDIHYFKTAP